MIKPDYDATLTGRKVEELLLDRLTDMFYSMQTRRGDLFDESVEWVEYLLSWETDSYKELIEYRKKLSHGYVLKLSEYYLAARKIESVLQRRRYISMSKIRLDWQYRKDLILKVVEIFFKRQILQYRKTTYAKIEGVKDGEILSESSDSDETPERRPADIKDHTYA